MKAWMLYGVGLMLFGLAVHLAFRAHDDAPPNIVFQGSSTDLKYSVVAPTLNCPIPPGKTVVWCLSFQMAWNRLKSDVIKSPIKITGAEKFADDLNAALENDADVSPADYFAAAGFAKDGIVGKINAGMAEKFPGLRIPKFGADSDIIAFACIAAKAKFAVPFRDNKDDFAFTDSSGAKTQVSSFGLHSSDYYGSEKMREQVQILHYLRDADPYSTPLEFIVDLSKNSTNNQIVLASVPPKATLAETLAYVETRIEKHDAVEDDEEFKHEGSLIVPKMSWYLDHQFSELTGMDKRLGNAGFAEHYLSSAMQSIDFQLDHAGAEIISKAVVDAAKPDKKADHPPPKLVFDRPLLLYLKKRGAARPFFVMWVDNAELLSKK